MLSSFLFIPLAERSHRRVLSHLYPAALPARRRLRTVPSNLSRGQRKKSHVRRRRGDTGRQESYSTCRVLDTRQSLFLYSSRLLLLSSSRCAETCIKTRKKIAQNENSLGALRGWLLRRRFGADRSTSLTPPPAPPALFFFCHCNLSFCFLFFQFHFARYTLSAVPSFVTPLFFFNSNFGLPAFAIYRAVSCGAQVVRANDESIRTLISRMHNTFFFLAFRYGK